MDDLNQEQTTSEPTPETSVETATTVDWNDDSLGTALAGVSETEESSDAPFPPTATETDATPKEAEEAPTAEEPPVEPIATDDEEEPTLEDVIENPFKLSRKQLREVEKDFLTPLRDPNVSISEVRDKIRAFHPTRFGELEQDIVNKSAQDNPNEWLQAVTGIPDLTVDKVKSLLERGDVPAQSAQPEQHDTEKYLDDLYDDVWKSADNDHLIHSDDINTVKAQRRVIELQNLVSKGNPEMQAKLDKAQEELATLRPEIDEIKRTQKAEFETAVQTTQQSLELEYRTVIEQKTIPKLFTELNLNAAENDADDVKLVKEGVRTAFESKNGWMSEFEVFMVGDFSKKEAMSDIVGRVKPLLADAAIADVKARTDSSQKERAASLKAQATLEQNTLAVLTKAAIKEFMESPRVKGSMALLERIADLERRFSQGGRPEIIGSAATGTNTTWKDGINPTDWTADDILGERLSQMAR